MKKITITIEALKEDWTPERSEKKTSSAREQMKTADGLWGWCTVRVTAKDDEGNEGHSYLGDCSYQDAADFCQNSGYLPQMVEEAIVDILPKLVVKGK